MTSQYLCIYHMRPHPLSPADMLVVNSENLDFIGIYFSYYVSVVSSKLNAKYAILSSLFQCSECVSINLLQFSSGANRKFQDWTSAL